MKATMYLVVSIMLFCIGSQAQQNELETPHDAVAILATAHSIKIQSWTDLMKKENLEADLLSQPEFKSLGLELVVGEDCGPCAAIKGQHSPDLVVKVQRSPFTTSFPYSVSDPHTGVIVAAGRVNSLGGTAYHKIARELIKAIQDARTENTNRHPTST
jgi:hypothetical protein